MARPPSSGSLGRPGRDPAEPALVSLSASAWEKGLGGGGGEICWQIIEFFELEGKKKKTMKVEKGPRRA